jgi:hypothetical protein
MSVFSTGTSLAQPLPAAGFPLPSKEKILSKMLSKKDHFFTGFFTSSFGISKTGIPPCGTCPV